MFRRDNIPPGKFQGAHHRLPDATDVFDVAICGAGPCGATCAYYLAQLGAGLFAGTGLRIALLEKATFPRDKYCGDAWCAPALDLLEDMGVLQELEAEGLVCDCLAGGFVSPAGHSFIANDRDAQGKEKNMETRCYAIKRIICDERIARKAAGCPGVKLMENACVEETKLDEADGVWTVKLAGGKSLRCRMLVAADGAASNIARKLGIVTAAPEGVACRRYVKGGTHNFKADGVLLYPEYTLPGYVALFRHYDDTIDLGCYLLPGGTAKDEDIHEIYEKRIMSDPFVSRALGPNVEYAERLKCASLRLGGVKQSYGEQVVLVGDAAGQVDPLTGEGIHTGMEGGKIAAETLVEMFRQGNFSEAAGSVYHSRWMKAFGNDFFVSSAAGKVMLRLPFLMDAVPLASHAKGGRAGSQFFADFGAVMTGVKPKTTFLRPSVAIPLATATLKEVVKQFVLRSGRKYMQDPLAVLDKELSRSTSWDAQCLIDTSVQVGSPVSGAMSEDAALREMFQYAAPDTHDSASEEAKRVISILVLYGSEYGYSKDLAIMLCERISSLSFADAVLSPRCMNMLYFDLIDWQRELIVLTLCSTAGDGVPPSQARGFVEFLQTLSEGSTFHPDTYHAGLALGDVAYPHFCQAGKDIASAMNKQSLRQLPGSTEGMDLRCVCVDGEDVSQVEEWMAAVERGLEKLVENIEIDFERAEGRSDYLVEKVKADVGRFADENRASRDSPFMGVLESKRLLTHPELDADRTNPKEVWHIAFNIAEGDGEELLDYLPGDALGVLPENNPIQILEILKLLDIPPSLNVGDKTVMQYLKQEKDLQALPSAFLNSLDAASTTDKKDERHVFDVLHESLDKIERMSETEKLGLLQHLNPLLPRYYSIASSPSVDKGKIHLCVAAVRYSVLGKSREGVASTFLIDRVTEGSKVGLFVQRNPDFRLPHDPQIPKIMIGPGTGIAPFMSFIKEEEQLRDEGKKEAFGQSMLFFGCRHEKADFLYRDVLQKWTKKAKCKLVTAFSRDSAKKQYVQHRMAEEAHRTLIWEMLCREGQVYICGDGWRMAQDVKQCLVDIVMKSSVKRMTEEEAEGFLKPRLHLDVWVV